MLTVIYPKVSSLAQYVAKYDFFIVGELHGIEQNALIMQEMIDAVLTLNEEIGIAFEWVLTEKEYEEIQAFVDNRLETIKTPSFFLNSDGRVTQSHLALLHHLRLLNQKKRGRVRLFIFDGLNVSTEVDLAKNLLHIRSEISCPILVETGTVHAAKDEINTMAGVLAKTSSVFSTFIHYETGLVNVEGEVLNVRDSLSQQTGPQNLFDATIVVQKAEPFPGSIPLTISR